MLSRVVFLVFLGVTVFLFMRRILTVRKNILLGKDEYVSDSPRHRWKRMFMFAFAQGKMPRFKWAGILHLFVYVGFFIINLEIFEILVDGVFGTHRSLSSVLGGTYVAFIFCIEVLAVLVISACVIFLLRRNVLNVQRLRSAELNGFPMMDANIILFVEVLLMSAFLTMNAADLVLSERVVEPYSSVGFASNSFSLSLVLSYVLIGFSDTWLIFVERVCWWFHILGVFGFMIYIPYSKHFHIFLAFPNTYFASSMPLGKLVMSKEVGSVVQEVLNPGAQAESEVPERFGAKDVKDLSWQNLLAAYSCTECGRCTASCPANQTGKRLSPRKIMMDTRDRIEQIGKGEGKDKTLLYDFVLPEEVMACTTCSACVEVCPLLINPLDIILKLRWCLVMDEPKFSPQWTSMFANLENNGAPWQFAASQRADWRKSV